LAGETGATTVWAADAADPVIISIPQKNVPDLAADIRTGTKPDAPVIETNNYYPRQRDGPIEKIEKIEAGMPESVWVGNHVGAPVIKVFNGIWWKHLLENGEQKGADGRVALPIAGADGPAKRLVFALVEDLGLDAVNGGTLAESWRQQPGTPVYGKDFGIADTERALAEARTERPEGFRAAK
jgi:hypothetical protein